MLGINVADPALHWARLEETIRIKLKHLHSSTCPILSRTALIFQSFGTDSVASQIKQIQRLRKRIRILQRERSLLQRKGSTGGINQRLFTKTD